VAIDLISKIKKALEQEMPLNRKHKANKQPDTITMNNRKPTNTMPNDTNNNKNDLAFHQEGMAQLSILDRRFWPEGYLCFEKLAAIFHGSARQDLADAYRILKNNTSQHSRREKSDEQQQQGKEEDHYQFVLILLTAH
jgi:hypothetical protein